MIRYLKKLDWWLIISALLLVGIGLLSIYSSSMGRHDFTNFIKQTIFLGIGIFLMIFLSLLDWRIFRENSYLILTLYLMGIFSLIGLFFFAPEIRGVKGWYKVGSFSIDPIEFIKIVLLILLAKYFSMRHIEMYRLSHIILSGIYTILPVVLIFFQPNMGSALILVFLWVGILIISGIKIRHFLALVLCGILILIISWSFLLRNYQKERIISFFEPKIEPLGMAWSQNQAKIAIGSGGILGQGIGKGSQTQYGFLPEPQTDFIFAAIAEEIGLIGVSFLLILFVVLIWRIMRIAILAESNFPRLFASGLVLILIPQVFIHIGMNLGISPIIGLALPLVSYGGSGLIATFIGLGILQSLKIH